MALTDALVTALATGGVPAAVANAPTNVGAKPYVVIWPDGPVRTPSKLNDSAGEQTTVLVCHCLGLTPESAYVAERKLATAVLGLYRQVIDGRSVQFPVQDWAQPLVRDDDISPALYDLAVEWRLRTTPA